MKGGAVMFSVEETRALMPETTAGKTDEEVQQMAECGAKFGELMVDIYQALQHTESGRQVIRDMREGRTPRRG